MSISIAACFRSARSLALGTFLLLATTASIAAIAAHYFRISAGDGPTVLREFGAQSGMQILFDERVLQPLQLPGVTGEYEAEEALLMLLRGTGLTFDRVDDRTFAVRASGISAHGRPSYGEDRGASPSPAELQLVTRQESAPASLGADVDASASQGGGASRTASGGLDEVVVTAERRTTNLQETPIAVTALDGLDLERLQVQSTRDLDVMVPSSLVDNNIASSASLTLSMRGNAEQNAGFLFSEPGVGLYVNGVYRRLSGGNLDMLDIERVEVLRGPQGTLFGRNTLAGAINLVTRRPSGDASGRLALGWGAFDTFRTQAALAGAVSDSWAASASASHERRGDGWLTDLASGDSIGEEKRTSLAATLTGALGDAWRVDLNAYHSELSADGQYGSPVSVATGAPLSGDLRRVAYASVLVDGSPRGPFVDNRQTGADLSATWSSDRLTFKSITSYLTLDDSWAIDFTAGQYAAPPPASPFAPVPGTTGFFRLSSGRQTQWAQEFQLLGESPGRNWLVGLFAYDESSEQRLDDFFAGGFFRAVPAIHELDARSYAVFGQFTQQLAQSLSVTVGARHSRDEKGFGGAKGDNTGVVQAPFASDTTFSETTVRATADYRLTADHLVYLTFSQGYKAGLYDPFAPAPQIAEPLDPERVNSLELGAKTEWADGRLRVNVAAFLTRYEDLVISTITPSGLLQRNAGEEEVRGLEVEATLAPTRAFRLQLAASLLDGKWRRLAAEALATGVQLSDDPPLVYDAQFTLSGTYRWEVPAGTVELTGTYQNVGPYYVQVAHLNNALDRTRTREALNASAVLRTADDRHELALTGRNLTGENDYYNSLNFSTFLFNNTAAFFPVEPRSWQVGYTYRWR